MKHLTGNGLLIQALKIENVLFVFGIVGMIMGSIYAFREVRIKKMLAYSSVAQIGYIFMGFGIGNMAGFTASCFHILAHAATKTLLFVSVGSLIETNGGKTGNPEISLGLKLMAARRESEIFRGLAV